MSSSERTNNLSSPSSRNTSGEGGTGGFVIPAIDIINGKAVRLTHGDYTKEKVYFEHPVEAAKQFEDAGLSRLHLVDLDGAKAGAVKNWKVLEILLNRLYPFPPNAHIIIEDQHRYPAPVVLIAGSVYPVSFPAGSAWH